jgi:hypothetical protein
MPTLLDIPMTMAMYRYYTARIAQGRSSRALLEATGCRHWASTCSNKNQLDMPTPVFCGIFHCQIIEKGCKVNRWPLLTKNDEKHFTNLREYFVVAVKVAGCSLKT